MDFREEFRLLWEEEEQLRRREQRRDRIITLIVIVIGIGLIWLIHFGVR